MLFSLHGTMHHLSRVSFTKAASYCSDMKTKKHDNVELLSMAKLFPKEFPNGTQRSVCHRQYLSTHRLIRQVCGKVETQGPSLEGANLQVGQNCSSKKPGSWLRRQNLRHALATARLNLSQRDLCPRAQPHL